MSTPQVCSGTLSSSRSNRDTAGDCVDREGVGVARGGRGKGGGLREAAGDKWQGVPRHLSRSLSNPVHRGRLQRRHGHKARGEEGEGRQAGKQATMSGVEEW